MASEPVRKRVVKSAGERRRELLDAALAEFRDRGANEATVEHITNRAGVAKGTFYRYFDSRDDILAALRAEVGNRMLGEIAARVGANWATPEEWWLAVDTTLTVFVDYLIDNPEEHHALWHTSPAAPVLARSADDPFWSFADLVRQGVEAGVFRCDDPDMTFVLLFSAVHGAADFAIADPTVDRARLVSAARVLAHDALGDASVLP